MANKAKNTKLKTAKKPKFQKLKAFLNNRQTHTVFGLFLVIFSIFLCIAFFSFFFSWQADQSTLTQFTDKTITTKNLLGKIGAKLSHFFIYDGFGLAALIIPVLLFVSGLYWLFKISFKRVLKTWNVGVLIMLWLAISFGFISKKYIILAGVIGLEVNEYLQTFLGKTGLTLVLGFLFLTYIVIRFKVTPESVISKFKSKEKLHNKEETTEKPLEEEILENEFILEDNQKPSSEFEKSVTNLQPTISNFSEVKKEEDKSQLLDVVLETEIKEEATVEEEEEEEEEEEVKIDIDQIEEEEHSTENLSEKLVKDFGEFDPTLELGNYKFPTFNLLKQYNESISIDPEELEANKNKILETLKNYKIGISKIKATVEILSLYCLKR